MKAQSAQFRSDSGEQFTIVCRACDKMSKTAATEIVEMLSILIS